MGMLVFWKPLVNFGISQIKYGNWFQYDTEICIIIQVCCNSCSCLPSEVTFLVYVPNIYKVNWEPFFCLLVVI